MRVIFSDRALESTEEPKVMHKRKSWMTEGYHNRIQKKWIKRWGYEMKPCFYMTPAGIIAHPALRPVIESLSHDITKLPSTTGKIHFRPGLKSGLPFI